MKKIGLTGGIGAGKTYVSRLFRKLGYPVFNADFEAKHCMNHDKSLMQQIEDAFGQDIYLDNELDTQKLAEIVFNDSDQLNRINALVHPVVKQRFFDWANTKGESIVIKETAILFESGSHLDLDAVICVACPSDICVERVMQRDQLDKQQVLSRMDNQMSKQEQETLSDYIIFNDGKQLLLPQILEIIKEIG